MQTSGKNFILLLLILLAGIALRIYHLDNKGIWLDEKISLAESNGFTYINPPFKNYFTNASLKQQNTLANVINATIKEDGGNGMLYIFKLHYWQQYFGSTDFALRMLSLIFGCLLILAAYYFSLKLFQSERIALITAVLITLHPLLIKYAQEVRPYSMATFFSFLSTLFFYNAFTNSDLSKKFKLHVIAFGFFSACALFTHYLTVYIFLAQGLYFLIYVKGKKIWTGYIISWLGVIAVFTLWMLNGGLEGLHYMSVHNEQYTQQLALLKEGENAFLLHANFKNVFLGWMQLLLAAAGNTLQNGGFRLRVLSLLLLIPITLVLVAIRKNNKGCKNKKTLLITLVLAAPVYATILALLSGHTISFQPAYGIFAAPYIMMLVALGCEKLLTGNFTLAFKTILAGSFGILIIGSIYFHYSIDNRIYSATNPNPLLGLAKIIENETTPIDTIVFPTFADAIITNIYLAENVKSIQMVDTAVKEKVILKNSNKVLFDFENGKYRY